MVYKFVGKRLIDLLLFVVAIFPFIAIAVLICCVSAIVFKGKVFYNQDRLGYRNRVFRLYKFATLLPEKQGGKWLNMQDRQTRWGKFLRDYSLDELPQLLNIFKGEMSFVGPRPLLPEYKEIYTSREAVRHHVKPGLTGLAQVRGRNRLSWNEKMEYDLQYVALLNFRLDIRILLETVGVVLKGQVINYGAAPERDRDLQWVKN